MRYSLKVLIVLSVVARPADAQQKIITPDLKAIANGKGAKIPDNVSLMWVEDAKGKPALKIQSTKNEFGTCSSTSRALRRTGRMGLNQVSKACWLPILP